MATAVQRTKAIADALINGDASAPLIESMVNGMLHLTPAEVASLTAAQKAQQFLAMLRARVKTEVAEYEGGAAANAARAAVVATVDTNFTETP